MTPEQHRLLHLSFARIEPFSQKFGDLFYARFFSQYPALKTLFSHDLKAQQAKFMKVVSEIVRLPLLTFPVTASQNAEALVPGAYWGGMLHGGLGVKHEDFPAMKNALLWALTNSQDFDVSEAELEAWSTAYDILTIAMSGGLQSWYDEQAGRVPSVRPPDETGDPRQSLKSLTNR
jgi:hemoglobin-like flavoprotein